MLLDSAFRIDLEKNVILNHSAAIQQFRDDFKGWPTKQAQHGPAGTYLLLYIHGMQQFYHRYTFHEKKPVKIKCKQYFPHAISHVSFSEL